ncbi:MAG: ACP phosphodiesterase [Xanthomonadaceae bacterium]|jgi:acyl carrier protein phosphodiesterase|nr:ACP phosphodiesterase [Xanthomonadaceae bacterium]
MNHLAHAWLAGDAPAWRIGSLLGDFWRGAPDPGWPPGVAEGVRLHRRVDAFTDAHPAMAAARALFDPPLRRYAGILLDVWFDHLLATAFEARTGRALRGFADEVYATLAAAPADLPAPFRLFAARAAQFDVLAGYAERERLDVVFARLSERLSRANPIAHALPVMEALEQPLGRAFDALWVDLERLRPGGEGLG